MENALVLIFVAYIAIYLFETLLEYLNIRHLVRSSHRMPVEFEGLVEMGFLARSQDYCMERARFGLVASFFTNAAVLVFFFGGLLDLYNSWVASMDLPFVVSGLVFFLILLYADFLLSIPLGLYRTFWIEKKHGFNTTTPGLWAADLLKSLALSTAFSAVVIAVGLWIVERSPGLWWLWIWSFLLAFSIFIMYLSPYLIEPLFNKFTPVEEMGLVRELKELAGRAGIRVDKVLRMDASRRTTHTNAYFTGVGSTKRIVLYDTLMESMDRDELLTVVAHEAGHWRKRHVLKQIVTSAAITLLVLYVSFELFKGGLLTGLFDVREETFFSKVLVMGLLLSLVSFPAEPVVNFFSRRRERAADDFALELTNNSGAMATAFVKLSKDNLANPYPHPLYVLFNYSHPPVLERIRHIREVAR